MLEISPSPMEVEEDSIQTAQGGALNVFGIPAFGADNQPVHNQGFSHQEINHF